MNAIESVKHYSARISAELNNCLTETSLSKVPKRTGKVRDQYDLGDKIALITTDRQSAFDRVLASIPLRVRSLTKPAPGGSSKPKILFITMSLMFRIQT